MDMLVRLLCHPAFTEVEHSLQSVSTWEIISLSNDLCSSTSHLPISRKALCPASHGHTVRFCFSVCWHLGMWLWTSPRRSGNAWTLLRGLCTLKWCWRITATWSLSVRTFACRTSTHPFYILTLTVVNSVKLFENNMRVGKNWFRKELFHGVLFFSFHFLV